MRRLKSALLPTLGRPTIATVAGRSIAPSCSSRGCTVSDFRAIAVIPRTLPCSALEERSGRIPGPPVVR